MAIRFNANADRLSRNANLIDYDTNYSVLFWLYLVSDRNDWGDMFSISRNNAADYDVVGVDDTGTNIWVEATPGAGTWGVSLNVGQWYHIALVRSATNDLTVYLDGVLEITEIQNVARAAPDLMQFNGTGNEGEWLDMRIAYTKAWETNLSVAEIRNEMWTIRPVRTANLYAWWPMFPGATERDNDYGGNNYPWTQAGALTDEDPPPVSWGAISSSLIGRSLAPPIIRIPRIPAAYNTLAIY